MVVFRLGQCSHAQLSLSACFIALCAKVNIALGQITCCINCCISLEHINWNGWKHESKNASFSAPFAHMLPPGVRAQHTKPHFPAKACCSLYPSPSQTSQCFAPTPPANSWRLPQDEPCFVTATGLSCQDRGCGDGSSPSRGEENEEPLGHGVKSWICCLEILPPGQSNGTEICPRILMGFSSPSCLSHRMCVAVSRLW